MYKKVYIEITNICNMNCSFCHGHKRMPRFMTDEEFKFIIEKLKGYTDYIYYHLMGEPLIHPKLNEFIKLASEHGYKSIITTNGTLLVDRQEEILNNRLHKINISLHSFENGSDEDFIRYISNLANIANKANSIGIIVVFRLWNQGYDNGKNEIAINTLKQYITGEWKENKQGIKIKDKMFIELGQRFSWPDSNADIQGDRFYCYGLKDQFGILVDGTVVPCCLDSEAIINLGNVFKENIENILNSSKSLDIVKGFKCGKATEDLCKRCGYAQRFV